MRLSKRLATTTACLAAASVLAAATACASWRAFSLFAPYDDEGYILQSVRSYLDGQRLFEEIFTQYGPAFYVLESLIHQTLRAPLTHDFERFMTVATWVLTSALCAGTVQRLTASSMATALTFGGAFIHLVLLINEPGHPQGVLVLLVALVIIITAWNREGAPLSYGHVTIVGVLTAFALLMKVNVGAYLALGFALPVLLSTRLPRSRITFVLLSTVLAAACLLPLIATGNHLRGWALNYALVTCLSLASTIVVVASGRRGSLPAGVIRHYVLTTGVACAVLLLPALIRGISLLALLNGIVIRPSQLATVFQIPLILPATSVLCAGAGLVLSVAFVPSTKLGSPRKPLVVAGMKALAAVAGFYLCHAGYFSLLTYFTPLLWVVAVPSNVDLGRGQPLARSVLALMAVFQSLQAYPVAGSQVAFATVLMVPIAVVCAHDALAILQLHFGRSRVPSWAVQASFVLTGLVLYKPFADPRMWRAQYAAGYEAQLPGAERLRLPAADVARYQWLTGTVAANCGTLLTLPGLYSLNAWSGVAPAGYNVTAWMALLSDEEQASVWRAAETATHPCVIYNPTLAATWLVGESAESLSAYRVMKARFHPIAESGGYQLLMRQDDVPPSGAFLI